MLLQPVIDMLEPKERLDQVECGSHFSAARTTTGRVMQWGTDYCRVLASPTFISFPPRAAQVVAISCGRRHTLALDDLGRVYSWGCGLFGRLGLGHDRTRNEPTLVSEPLALERVAAVAAG